MSRIFIISAPSGSGKSTLVRRLLAWDRKLLFSISYTTRAPRGEEVNGREYHFITRAEFEERLGRGEFLEHADVFGNYYGTHNGVVLEGERSGQDVVLDIDVQGARQLKEKLPGAVSIFILAPSKQELEKRLRSRGEDQEEVIGKRLAGAAREISHYQLYDYVLVNDDVDEASGQLIRIVEAERLSPQSRRIQGKVQEILDTFKDG
jgi:guanylate kinase